ncbi:MAG: hypothetical protein D6695_12375 [Planctomycetota bacterium]|nr:MAG: hypothetical protein D6695_12375 [Planctomycetota bacterium]
MAIKPQFDVLQVNSEKNYELYRCDRSLFGMAACLTRSIVVQSCLIGANAPGTDKKKDPGRSRGPLKSESINRD